MKLAELGRVVVRVLSEDEAGLQLRVLQLGSNAWGQSGCRSWALRARVEDGVAYLWRDQLPTVLEHQLHSKDLSDLPDEVLSAVRAKLGLAGPVAPNLLALQATAAHFGVRLRLPVDVSHLFVLGDPRAVAPKVLAIAA